MMYKLEKNNETIVFENGFQIHVDLAIFGSSGSFGNIIFSSLMMGIEFLLFWVLSLHIWK